MTRINNLFFMFMLVCIGCAIAEVYWNKDYSHYVCYALTGVIGVMIIFSKSFYTFESCNFFAKQTFMTSFISLLCIFFGSESNVFKVIEATFKPAWIGATMLWIFSRKYRYVRKKEKDEDDDLHGGGPTLA